MTQVSKRQRTAQVVLLTIATGCIIATIATGSIPAFIIGSICGIAGLDKRQEDEK